MTMHACSHRYGKSKIDPWLAGQHSLLSKLLTNENLSQETVDSPGVILANIDFCLVHACTQMCSPTETCPHMYTHIQINRISGLTT